MTSDPELHAHHGSTVPNANRPAGDHPALQIDRSAADLAICCRGLSKQYRNPWTMKVSGGLHDLNLEIRRGEVFGYLGPNGAGKTTTLKLLTGLLKPTSGRAWLLGEPIENTAARRRLGFLPEQPYFYDYLSGLEYLELAGRLSGLGGQDARERAKRWIGRVGLGDRPRLLLRKYSKGMLQRLGLAAALVHDPDLIILDEPMSGLDPFGRRDVRDLILEQRARGVTVMFSSHILPDVEMLCDRVGILMKGRLIRVATLHELTGEQLQRVEIRCAGEPTFELPVEWRELIVRGQRPHETLLTLSDGSRLSEVLHWLLAQQIEVRAVTPQRSSLEQLFLATAEQSNAEDRARRSA